MNNKHCTVRVTLDVVYSCGPLGFAVTDKHRLLAAIRFGIQRAGVAKDVLAMNAVVIERTADKEPTK
jgi:hypothetical protein